ncbi:hypothetical protein [Sporosarcina obsidiansis]|uniref:hypothetical protein n=1 Tax=Sporosarcina obsidiansis TaxID=2660748 RepID=UPI00129AE12C|nr:hypothetical protein [Sporosarcina obsidiansis]
MNSKNSMKATWIGIISGVILALFLKVVQSITDHQVYTLLLNVDYIPIVKEYQFPEVVEVLFHLIVSVILCTVFVFLYDRGRGTFRKHIIFFSLAINVLIGLLLYPTTSFSERTPSVTSIPALCWWVLGHTIYGALVGILLGRNNKK